MNAKRTAQAWIRCARSLPTAGTPRSACVGIRRGPLHAASHDAGTIDIPLYTSLEHNSARDKWMQFA